MQRVEAGPTMFGAERGDGSLPQSCAGQALALRPAERDHPRAERIVARRAVGVAQGEDDDLIRAGQRRREVAERRDAPVVLIGAEAGDDEANFHRCPIPRSAFGTPRFTTCGPTWNRVYGPYAPTGVRPG